MTKKQFNKYGQLFSMDASLSVIVFIFILIFLVVVWNLYSVRLDERVQEEEMQLAAMQALDTLTKTWGVPNNWNLNPAAAQAIGLRLNPGSLDNDKVEGLRDPSITDANFAKRLNIDRYDYYFRILNSIGQPVLEKGDPASGTKKMIVSVSSFMYHQGENCEVVLTLRK